MLRQRFTHEVAGHFRHPRLGPVVCRPHFKLILFGAFSSVLLGVLSTSGHGLADEPDLIAEHERLLEQEAGVYRANGQTLR